MEATNHTSAATGGPQNIHRQTRLMALIFLTFLVLGMQTDRRYLASHVTETKETNRISRDLATGSAKNDHFNNDPTQPKLKCALWEEDMDVWWQMHPEWEPHGENETHTCFRPIQNTAKAQWYREIYQNQYHGKRDCTEIRTRNIVGVGYAAYINWVTFGFWSAMKEGYPFDVTHHRDGFRWMYAPQEEEEAAPEQEKSWADCPYGDHRCFFLPISNCHPPNGHPESRVATTQLKRERDQSPTEQEKFVWMELYLTRPKQIVRKKLMDLMKEEAPVMDDGPCTWIHVRRGDAMTEKFARNFYTVSEYLERGNVSTTDNVLLFTDDETAIDEATLLHPQYKWNFWKRTRNRGATKKNAHFPSNDHAKELMIILGEMQLAGKCQKGVHGTSNMVDMFKYQMINNYGLGNIETTQIDEELKNEEFNTASFIADLEAKLEEARKRSGTAAA